MQICVNIIFFVSDLKDDLQNIHTKKMKNTAPNINSLLFQIFYSAYYTYYVVFTFSTRISLCGNSLINNINNFIINVDIINIY